MGQVRSYKVSVVTAVYNVEKYLEEMIMSITSQTIGFENIQLILVDDGSTDGSRRICEKYAAKYPENIVTVYKENGGVSSARNEGLKYAVGEYINFTDADDMLESNALELMFAYLKENDEEIDVVAIPLKLFGRISMEHPLNDKFSKTRVIDLEKEYNCVQLSISSTLIKKDCFATRRFDNELSYAEDARMLLDIFTDRMKYGAVCETCYRYRKHDDEDSAIDTGRNKASYYIPYMEKFILCIMEKAVEKIGYVPRFIQYACMYDLQWRLTQNEFVKHGAITGEEIRKYKQLMLKALESIENKMITEQKNLGNNYKRAILLLKKDNIAKKELVFDSNDIRVRVRGSFTSVGVGAYLGQYEFASIDDEKLTIEGYVRYFPELEDINVVFRQKQNGMLIEYTAELVDRKEHYSYCMNEVITKAKGFRFHIYRGQMLEDMDLQLCIRYKNTYVICNNIAFGSFFPLTKDIKSSYLYKGGVLITHSENALKILKLSDEKKVKEYEKLFQEELLNCENVTSEDINLRKLYFRLKKLKRKEVWLICDRFSKADDNGEAFFTYMNTKEKAKDIKTYFMLEKDSKDYERLKKIGNVVPFNSKKHKLLYLLCDKVISAHTDDFATNCFKEKTFLYKDILNHRKFVYLKHGIIKNDRSRSLRRSSKNIGMLVTATKREHESIFHYDYCYDESCVKCTGLARYDFLYDNKNGHLITFMPTWRLYLARDCDLNNYSRQLIPGFEESTYCQMYQKVFENQHLYEMAEKYHYTLALMMHPAMPRDCAKYFNCENRVKVLDISTRYNQIFADSKLVITDYSSAVFDFAYLRKPVIYFQHDAEEFFSGSHICEKGYFDYERDGFGEVEYTADDLVNRIIEYMENGCRLKDLYRERIENTFLYHDKENCKRIYDEIIKL